jgi:hypothetical protein
MGATLETKQLHGGLELKEDQQALSGSPDRSQPVSVNYHAAQKDWHRNQPDGQCGLSLEGHFTG